MSFIFARKTFNKVRIYNEDDNLNNIIMADELFGPFEKA